MKNYKLDDNFLERYKKFLASADIFDSEDDQKTDYWRHHSQLLNVKMDGSNFSVDGSSGFYVPGKTYFDVFKKFLRTTIFSPRLIFNKLQNKILSFLKVSGHLSPEKAFDLISSFNPEDSNAKEYIEAFSARSPDRIDFHKVTKKEGSFSKIKEIRKFSKGRYILNTQMIFSYYLYNIFNFFSEKNNNLTILEIGGGNGNLMSVLHDNCPNSTIIDVDLPETLCSAILFIKEMYPESKILLPNEIEGQINCDYDFIFITPSQLDFVQSKTIDVCINISSFQEMTLNQISKYFNFLYKSLKQKGLFITVNRVEKLFNESPATRFADYPWNKRNQIVAYEIDPFFHLTCPNDHFLRIEKITDEGI